MENDDDDSYEVTENDDTKDEYVQNSTFVNPSQVESEMVEFDVFVTGLGMINLYTNSIPEVEKVENLWITPNQVGSLLPTNIKLKTKFANKFRKDTLFRQSIWKKLEFVETCPEQE